MSKPLQHYIHQSLGHGTPKAAIRQTLVQAGWADDVVGKMLDQYTGTDAHGVPIPAPKAAAHHLARDLFLYALMYVTLGVSVCSLGALLFDWANQLIPDPLHAHAYRENLNWAIACLAIAFPVFLGMNRWVNTSIRDNPEKRESFVRKLMIYWMLIQTAVVSLCDLIWAVTAFLNGDLAANAIAHTAIILGICAAIFGYYLGEVKKDDRLIQSKASNAAPAQESIS